MKKRLMRIAGLLCSLALVCGVVQPTAAAKTGMSISSVTSESIKEKENQISKAEKEKQNLKNNLSNVQQIKKDLETKKKDLNQYVQELDAQLAAIEERVMELKGQIMMKEAEIQETQLQLNEANIRERDQMEAMIVRARLMYEKKDSYALDLILESAGLGDILNKAAFMEKLVLYDKEQWTEYQNVRKLVQLCERQLELEKEILDQTRENVELEQNTIELFMQQKEQDLLAYENDINNQAQAIAEYEAMIKEQDEEIKALEAAIAEEKKRLIASNGVVLTYDGGTFKFPIASYTRVSSEYGNRYHPILHVNQFHNGVDLAAPKGTAIYAAYDGIVVAATYSPTMGNYVMIDHGNDLYTIYMHASSLKVKKGDVVIRGDTIALVGSTGRSTGNHLHFSVRRDGAYVSPWEYITP